MFERRTANGLEVCSKLGSKTLYCLKWRFDQIIPDFPRYGICSLFTGKYKFGVVPGWGICTLFLNPTVEFLCERPAPPWGICTFSRTKWQMPGDALFLIGHFIVVDRSEAEGDLVLIQTFLLYYVNQVILMLQSKEGLYQNKVTLNLASIHNCKMAYCSFC